MGIIWWDWTREQETSRCNTLLKQTTEWVWPKYSAQHAEFKEDTQNYSSVGIEEAFVYVVLIWVSLTMACLWTTVLLAQSPSNQDETVKTTTRIFWCPVWSGSHICTCFTLGHPLQSATFSRHIGFQSFDSFLLSLVIDIKTWAAKLSNRLQENPNPGYRSCNAKVLTVWPASDVIKHVE